MVRNGAWRRRLEVYGRLGIYVYIVIWLTTIAAFAVLIEMGLTQRIPWLAEHAAGGGATLVVAWALAKVLQIPRIALTLAVTPVIAKWIGK